MLNIGLNIKLDIDKVQYPVYFEKHNICIHCGAEGQLIFVDKFGRETKNEIHPFDHIKCKSCNRLYSITAFSLRSWYRSHKRACRKSNV